MQELIIIRHARSTYNIRASEDLDAGITDFGRQQSQSVGRFLRDHMDLKDFWFFTSPFLRCLQTADVIMKTIGIGRHPYGQRFGPVFKIYQPLREYLNHSGKDVHIPNENGNHVFDNYYWGDYPREGVTFNQESNEEFLQRMCDAYDGLPDKVVVVTHGLPALVLMHISQGHRDYLPIWDHSLDNCSITRIIKGRLVWRGRNLYHECENDIFANKRSFDKGDLLKTGEK